MVRAFIFHHLADMQQAAANKDKREQRQQGREAPWDALEPWRWWWPLLCKRLLLLLLLRHSLTRFVSQARRSIISSVTVHLTVGPAEWANNMMNPALAPTGRALTYTLYF